MKTFRTLLTVSILWYSLPSAYRCQGGDLPLTKYGKPLRYAGFEIVWRAPTNDLPATLSVYRVLPSVFSTAAISNIMGFSGLSAGDRKVPRARQWRHPSSAYYCNEEADKTLLICPNLGLIEYRNGRAFGNATNSAPSEAQMRRIAEEWLRRFGIPLSDVSPTPSVLSGEGSAEIPGPPRQLVHTVSSQNFAFVRRVEGVDFYDRGEFLSVRIHHDAPIHEILLSWRNLSSDRVRPVATPETIMQWMREGRCVAQALSYAGDHLDPNTVKKVVVHKITPYYYGEDRDVTQEWVYPFAKLETTVDIVRTNYSWYVPSDMTNRPIIFDSRIPRAENPYIRMSNGNKTNLPVTMFCPIIDDDRGP